MLVAAIIGRLVFKISLLDLLGTITGGMTSTPGLAAADSMVDSNIPSVAYATVYPDVYKRQSQVSRHEDTFSETIDILRSCHPV